MDKKEFRELMDNEDKTLINFNPELNQSGIYDNGGNRLKKAKGEQFDYIPRGFIDSGLIFYLTGKKDIELYIFLSSKCNKWRNTRVTNDFIIKNTGLKNATINRALKRLEFYHFISRRKYYMRSGMRRVITLLRWNTAYKKLIEEGKIKAKSDKEIYFIIPYKKGLPI
jgi:hypothetical protein